jgi:GNAT superfamily N-acetyltransferase
MSKIIEIQSGKSEVCNRVLRALPEWFGIEVAIQNYVRDVASMVMFVAKDENFLEVAFISLTFHNEFNAEIHVMGVLPGYHGQGLGTALVKHAEDYAREHGARYVTVKTLSPTRLDAAYEKTLRFYKAVGFLPLEEFKTLWGEDNPCLMMIKSL